MKVKCTSVLLQQLPIPEKKSINSMLFLGSMTPPQITEKHWLFACLLMIENASALAVCKQCMLICHRTMDCRGFALTM